MKNELEDPEISIESDKDETKQLVLDKSQTELSESFLYNLEDVDNNNKRRNLFHKMSFIIIFLIITFIFALGITIYYIIYYVVSEADFDIVELKWYKADLNDRDYQNYLFHNGLEVILIKDEHFDMDGGAIVIENGYLDNLTYPGIPSFATSILSHIAFKGNKGLSTLDDYYGNYLYDTEDHFINYRFDILNHGFTKFLSYFGNILDIKNISSYISDNYIKIINELDAKYKSKIDSIYYKEIHLIEYLVYGLCDSDNNDILPEGNNESLSIYNISEIKKYTQEYIQNLINPEKIKIILFSKYKFSISSKYMKKFFKSIIKTKKPPNNNIEEKKQHEIKEFNKSQIIYIKAKDYEQNYIKIIYYIDKVKNESYSELYYKSFYLAYIIDFISDTKNGSLYDLLNNSTECANCNVKSIETDYIIILKSKIKFVIKINLNKLEEINKIIFITYQYIYKIVNETIGENLQIDRYINLNKLCNQSHRYQEKTFNTIQLAKDNGVHVIQTKYMPELYFYDGCVFWNETGDNKTIIEETQIYLSQLIPNNSVIILGLKDEDRRNITCDDSCPFDLNCSHFKDDGNIKNTTYYNISYINYFFNSSDFEEYLNLNNSANISYTNNNYISSHYESFKNMAPEDVGEIEPLESNTSTLNIFYFKKNRNFHVPKVYITLQLFHPYLRPNNTDINQTRCKYFKIMEMFIAIRREINDKLADAIRANNEIEFGQNENYLFINITCFEDVAYNILRTIKNITIDKNWTLTDFITNNIIYKNEVYDDFLVYDKNNIEEISDFYFYYQLKNNLYNKYEFLPEDFDKYYYNTCIRDLEYELNSEKLTTFIINGYIYGFYDKTQAENIYGLFDIDNNISQKFEDLIIDVNINNITAGNYVNWVF